MNLMSKDISADFPISNKIYLNNASVSLMPSQSINAMNDFLISYNSLGPDSNDSASLIEEKLNNVRKIIAKIICCKSEEVILTQSTTDGINIVANGLSFDDSSNIIIRGMTHEHHSNFYPWIKLKNKISVRNLPIDSNGFFKLDDLKSNVDNNTKLLAISHALYNTGSILPVEKISDSLGKEIPFFIDSAQTIGCIGTHDVSKLGCDFMSFNGSKWLCGPMGTGLFYCKKESSELLEPKTIGGESAIIENDNNLIFKDLPEKFQTGFRNYVGIVGLESSVKYLLNFGMENIRKKNQNLSNIFRDELMKIPDVVLYGPEDPDKRTSIVSFNIKNFDSEKVVKKLEKQNIILAVREIMEKKIIRVSPHFFNNESDMLKVIDEIKKL
ncbi:MAG: aminotransferase class V-fold PLP-dependent enzyme [Nitrosopumilus sp.]|nr:aminotransferase class V-fold PLP-dependent enzyme [Nitrosopumilaceae archaeon]MBA4448004.1 aminotransferase class V-fold PLP-dependent enzyme [Nitrosopumilaceae archaeon]